MRSLLDLFSSSLRISPTSGSQMKTFSFVVLKFSACLSHLFNCCCFLLAKKKLTDHLAHFSMGHSYLQCTWDFCCIFNVIFSISTLISLRYLSISALFFCWWSLSWPHQWPSVSIFTSVFSPPSCLIFVAHLPTIFTKHCTLPVLTCCLHAKLNLWYYLMLSYYLLLHFFLSTSKIKLQYHLMKTAILT